MECIYARGFLTWSSSTTMALSFSKLTAGACAIRLTFRKVGVPACATTMLSLRPRGLQASRQLTLHLMEYLWMNLLGVMHKSMGLIGNRQCARLTRCEALWEVMVALSRPWNLLEFVMPMPTQCCALPALAGHLVAWAQADIFLLLMMESMTSLVARPLLLAEMQGAHGADTPRPAGGWEQRVVELLPERATKTK